SRAGVRSVALLSGGIPRADLEAAGADAVFRDVAELLARLDDSPVRVRLGPVVETAVVARRAAARRPVRAIARRRRGSPLLKRSRELGGSACRASHGRRQFDDRP
ncbi:hypothetical protein GA0115243_11161, partial [Streptomyces sp. ScaeMP-e83]